MESSLKWVEFAGEVGAGKTTLAKAFRAWASTTGIRAYTPEEAVQQTMARSIPGKWLGGVLPKASQAKILFTIYQYFVSPLSRMAFSGKHKELIRTVAKSSRSRAALTNRHKRIISRLFFDVAALYQFVLPRLKPDEVVVLDEGFFHRAVNLFAWETAELDCPTIHSYYQNLPKTDLVVMVHTQAGMGMERASARGLPLRLRDRSPEVVQRFSTHSREVVNLARETVEAREVIEINNTGSIEMAVRSLSNKAENLIHSNQQKFLPPVATGVPFLRIPRPDRLATRVKYQLRQKSRLPGDLDEMLALWGMRQIKPAHTAGGAGRSESLFVSTDQGIKILKRYKQSLDRDWILHEHSILKALSEVGFPAPHLVHTLDGSTFIEFNGKFMALFDAYEGYFQFHNYIFTPQMSQQFVCLAGSSLAALHGSLRNFQPEGRHPNGFSSIDGFRWRDLDWYLSSLERCATRSPIAFYGITTAWVQTRLRDLDSMLNAARLQRLIIHGDYGPYNLLFRQNSRVIVLDFELSRLDWRLIDLCSAFYYFAHGKSGFRWQKMRWFLEAYRSVEPIDQAELDYLPLVWQFITLRRIVLLWERFIDGEQGILPEIKERHDLLAWITNNQEKLKSL